MNTNKSFRKITWQDCDIPWYFTNCSIDGKTNKKYNHTITCHLRIKTNHPKIHVHSLGVYGRVIMPLRRNQTLDSQKKMLAEIALANLNKTLEDIFNSLT